MPIAGVDFVQAPRARQSVERLAKLLSAISRWVSRFVADSELVSQGQDFKAQTSQCEDQRKAEAQEKDQRQGEQQLDAALTVFGFQKSHGT